MQAENAIFSRFFDEVQATLLASSDEQETHRALDQLFGALRERKLNSEAARWNDFVAFCRRHPLMNLLHQDPFTYRAFSKPRGYAGDAVMMDFIYGHEEDWPQPKVEGIGRHVFNFTTSAPASEGVRARRACIATRIDRLAEEKRRPHVLSIAAGHLREAAISSAVRRRKLGSFVALDSDPLCAEEVKRCYGRYGIETVTSPFRRLLTATAGLGFSQFDFIYSTGLFDYLPPRLARRLVSDIFQMLRPGGTLLFANFLPGVRDIGYMEAFMDWKLVYRSRCDMVALTADIPENEVKEIRIFCEDGWNICFVSLTRN